MRQIGGFGHDTRGTTAVIFSLALVPVLGFGAAVLDYSRAAAARTQVQGALDATALMLARDAATLSDAQLQSRGQSFFQGQLKTNKHGTVLTPITVTRDSRTIRLAVNGTVPTAMMGVLGIQRMEIAGNSRVAWGGRKIELALVLDNTGSMGDTIGGQRKIDALKSAASDLLTTLEKAARAPGDVKVAIVPFNTQVKIDVSAKGAPWLKLDGLTDWNAWQGYIGDRDQISDYDVTDAAPIAGANATLYPAQPLAGYNGPGLATLLPLTTDFTALRARVSAMTPTGYTNIAIGTAWGHAALSNGTPLNQAAPYGDRSIEKIMIVLTDGDNTRNRFNQPSGVIDQRTRLACDSVKGDGIRLYTIRLLAGNAALLRNCASRNDMYYDVQNASQLQSAFSAIAAEITSIRLTQ